MNGEVKEGNVAVSTSAKHSEMSLEDLHGGGPSRCYKYTYLLPPTSYGTRYVYSTVEPRRLDGGVLSFNRVTFLTRDEVV